MPSPLLPHLSINPSNPTTILLVHGAFTNKDTWKPLLALLPQYHLLIPTLPGHHEAASSHPADKALTFSQTSFLLSQLSAPLPTAAVAAATTTTRRFTW